MVSRTEPFLRLLAYAWVPIRRVLARFLGVGNGEYRGKREFDREMGVWRFLGFHRGSSEIDAQNPFFLLFSLSLSLSLSVVDSHSTYLEVDTTMSDRPVLNNLGQISGTGSIRRASRTKEPTAGSGTPLIPADRKRIRVL